MLVDLSFSNLFFVFIAAIVASFGWTLGCMLLLQLSHMVGWLLRYLRTEAALNEVRRAHEVRRGTLL